MPEFDFKNPDYLPIFKQRVERLNRIRANPGCVPSLMAYYRDHPAAFINDWGTTFDPRNVERGLPAVVPFVLFPRQVEWVEWAVRHWKEQDSAPAVKSRDMGLSWLAIALACTLCLTHEGMVVGFGSRKEEYVDKIGSPKSLFYKGRMFMHLLPPELRGGFDQDKTAPHMRLLFPGTGSAVVGEAGDGIGRGDRASIYFVDESAFLERPQLVEASLSQTTNCRIDISTPNGLANPFAQRVLSGNFDTFTFHWRDDPRKDEEWYAKQKRILDPVTLAQEVDLDFAASVDGVLIPSAWVQAAIDSHIKLGFDPEGERLSALDVADQGKDTNAQALRNGILLEDVDEWHGKTVEDIYGTTQRAIDNCDEWRVRKMRFDSDGIGAGVRGDARAINEDRSISIETEAFHGSGEVHDKDEEFIEGRTNGEFFANFKAQSWWQLRMRFKATFEAVEEGKPYEIDDLISISSKCRHLPRLQTELSQPTYGKTARGKIVINKTPDGSKSPNLADCVNIVYSPEPEGTNIGVFVRRRSRNGR